MIWDDRPPPWQPTEEEYYANVAAIGSGALKRYFDSPESFFRHVKEMAETAAMGPESDAAAPSAPIVLGAAVDRLLTDPGTFHRHFVVTDSKGLGVHGVMKITPAAEAKAHRLVGAIRQHPKAAEILSRPALRQMCHAWERGGLLYRERVDYLTDTADGVPIVVDFKVWGIDVSKAWLVRQHAERTGAFVQLPLYGQGVERMWEVYPHLVLIIASSTTEEVCVHELQGDFLEEKIAEVEAAQDGLAECFRTGDFTKKKQQEIGSFGT